MGAQALADLWKASDVRPSAAIVGEPTQMAVIEGHKGCCDYTTRFRGQAGHVSAPDRGVIAVEYAVRYVVRPMQLAETLKTRTPSVSRFDPPWSSINTGVVSGGQAHNVIPENAVVEWEFRPVQHSDFVFVKSEVESYAKEILLPAMQASAPHATITTEIIGEVAGLQPATVNEARDIVRELRGCNGPKVVAFGTEAGIYDALGMSAVVCGPGSIDRAHKPDEFLAIDQLAKCLGMSDRLEGHLRV